MDATQYSVTARYAFLSVVVDLGPTDIHCLYDTLLRDTVASRGKQWSSAMVVAGGRQNWRVKESHRRGIAYSDLETPKVT